MRVHDVRAFLYRLCAVPESVYAQEGFYVQVRALILIVHILYNTVYIILEYILIAHMEIAYSIMYSRS